MIWNAESHHTSEVWFWKSYTIQCRSTRSKGASVGSTIDAFHSNPLFNVVAVVGVNDSFEPLYFHESVADATPKSSETSAWQMTIPPRVAVVVEQVKSSIMGGPLISIWTVFRLLSKTRSGLESSGIQRINNSVNPIREGVMLTGKIRRLPASFPPGIDIVVFASKTLFKRSRISKWPLATPGAKFSSRISILPFVPTDNRLGMVTSEMLISCKRSLYAAIFGSPMTVPIQERKVFDAA